MSSVIFKLQKIKLRDSMKTWTCGLLAILVSGILVIERLRCLILVAGRTIQHNKSNFVIVKGLALIELVVYC